MKGGGESRVSRRMKSRIRVTGGEKRQESGLKREKVRVRSVRMCVSGGA